MTFCTNISTSSAVNAHASNSESNNINYKCQVNYGYVFRHIDSILRLVADVLENRSIIRTKLIIF